MVREEGVRGRTAGPQKSQYRSSCLPLFCSCFEKSDAALLADVLWIRCSLPWIHLLTKYCFTFCLKQGFILLLWVISINNTNAAIKRFLGIPFSQTDKRNVKILKYFILKILHSSFALKMLKEMFCINLFWLP